MSNLISVEKMTSRASVEVNPGQCLRLRHKKSSCQLCVANCPVDAISFDQPLEINKSLCYGCGICVNVCPTAVFELKYLSYESLLARVNKGGVVEFTCSLASPSEDGMSVSCLGYLNEAVLIAAATHGSQEVRLNITQCKQCRFALGQRVAIKTMKRANRILALFGKPERVLTLVKECNGSQCLSESQTYSRRELFSYLRRETRNRVAAAIENVNNREEMAARTKVTLEPRLPKKRSLLLENIKKLGQPVTDQARADDLPFAGVEIGNNCDACGMCVTFCPTGALMSYQEGEQWVIDFNLGYCLACGLCADICSQGAISYSADINPWDLTTEDRVILVKHQQSVCVQCGQTHVAVSESRLCLNCQKKKGLEEWLTRI